ncbi:hypothetical protein [Haloarchaeobius sp. DFWS5]|uniref:hypothetical protein n=1 Tax=Haloarchaeobius sp. DFWS5 TaxID=3446114 RepID=UPI003EBC7CF3
MPRIRDDGSTSDQQVREQAEEAAREKAREQARQQVSDEEAVRRRKQDQRRRSVPRPDQADPLSQPVDGGSSNSNSGSRSGDPLAGGGTGKEIVGGAGRDTTHSDGTGGSSEDSGSGSSQSDQQRTPEGSQFGSDTGRGVGRDQMDSAGRESDTASVERPENRAQSTEQTQTNPNQTTRSGPFAGAKSGRAVIQRGEDDIDPQTGVEDGPETFEQGVEDGGAPSDVTTRAEEIEAEIVGSTDGVTEDDVAVRAERTGTSTWEFSADVNEVAVVERSLLEEYGALDPGEDYNIVRGEEGSYSVEFAVSGQKKLLEKRMQQEYGDLLSQGKDWRFETDEGEVSTSVTKEGQQKLAEDLAREMERAGASAETIETQTGVDVDGSGGVTYEKRTDPYEQYTAGGDVERAVEDGRLEDETTELVRPAVQQRQAQEAGIEQRMNRLASEVEAASSLERGEDFTVVRSDDRLSVQYRESGLEKLAEQQAVEGTSARPGEVDAQQLSPGMARIARAEGQDGLSLDSSTVLADRNVLLTFNSESRKRMVVDSIMSSDRAEEIESVSVTEDAGGSLSVDIERAEQFGDDGGRLFGIGGLEEPVDDAAEFTGELLGAFGKGAGLTVGVPLDLAARPLAGLTNVRIKNPFSRTAVAGAQGAAQMLNVPGAVSGLDEAGEFIGYAAAEGVTSTDFGRDVGEFGAENLSSIGLRKFDNFEAQNGDIASFAGETYAAVDKAGTHAQNAFMSRPLESTAMLGGSLAGSYAIMGKAAQISPRAGVAARYAIQPGEELFWGGANAVVGRTATGSRLISKIPGGKLDNEELGILLAQKAGGKLKSGYRGLKQTRVRVDLEKAALNMGDERGQLGGSSAITIERERPADAESEWEGGDSGEMPEIVLGEPGTVVPRTDIREMNEALGIEIDDQPPVRDPRETGDYPEPGKQAAEFSPEGDFTPSEFARILDESEAVLRGSERRLSRAEYRIKAFESESAMWRDLEAESETAVEAEAEVHARQFEMLTPEEVTEQAFVESMGEASMESLLDQVVGSEMVSELELEQEIERQLEVEQEFELETELEQEFELERELERELEFELETELEQEFEFEYETEQERENEGNLPGQEDPWNRDSWAGFGGEWSKQFENDIASADEVLDFEL